MGVQGLMTVCLERQDECTEPADLVEIARQRGGIELIVYFNCFKRHLIYRFWTGLSAVCNNPYIKILGGEYSSIERYVTKVIEDLKSLGIQLVFYTVGAKGSSTGAFLRRENTWIKRDEQDKENIGKLLDVCRGQVNILDLDDESSILPLLLEDQFIAAAKKCGCEFNQNPAGEANLLVLRALRERPKAHAILTNDTDFCISRELRQKNASPEKSQNVKIARSCTNPSIYPGSRFIPFQLFDIEDDLKLGQPVEVTEKPRRLMVKVITTEKVIDMLKVRNHTVLVEMTIVSGNDYTRQFMRGRRGYHRQLGFEGRVKLEDMARWMNTCGIVECNQVLSQKMRDNRQFRNAVNYCRNRYSLKAEPDVPPQKCNFSQLVADGIRSGKYPNIFMSIHNSYYWYKLLLEDIPSGQPCTERALIPLRSYIYRIVLPREIKQVKEYDRKLSEERQKAVSKVKAVEDQTVPSIDEIIEEDVGQNLRHFHTIMSHQEQDQDTDQGNGYWFDHYGMKDGFIVYLLRYFLLINWERNLDLSKNEYLALAAMVLGENNEAEYQRLVVKPTMKSVTIGNWFQNLYRHTSMLASALSIKSEFPLPSEIFSGSRWTAMYKVYTDQAFRDANEQVKVEMDAIIEGKRDMIDHIVEGIFTLDDK